MSRRLLIVPIIHTEAELGSEGGAHRAGYVARHGDRRWAEREAQIGRYWDSVHDALLESGVADVCRGEGVRGGPAEHEVRVAATRAGLLLE